MHRLHDPGPRSTYKPHKVEKWQKEQKRHFLIFLSELQKVMILGPGTAKRDEEGRQDEEKTPRGASAGFNSFDRNDSLVPICPGVSEVHDFIHGVSSRGEVLTFLIK